MRWGITALCDISTLVNFSLAQKGLNFFIVSFNSNANHWPAHLNFVEKGKDLLFLWNINISKAMHAIEGLAIGFFFFSILF